MAVYFFYGEEDFNIDLELDKMRSKLNPDFAELINAVRTTPMMIGSSLIIIDACKYFFSEGNKFEDKELQELDESLNCNHENVDIVFVVRIPRDDGKKIDTRRKLYKILSKFNVKEFPQFSRHSELWLW